jgi:hypothetical protein
VHHGKGESNHPVYLICHTSRQLKRCFDPTDVIGDDVNGELSNKKRKIWCSLALNEYIEHPLTEREQADADVELVQCVVKVAQAQTLAENHM